ncbi:MAG TPA: ankyrin repeat domain-containing protein, partial [Chloroflexia bacterium]|nr:ankyrin repeat domain-containing protein [Chloroflexia bacterium]
VPPQELVEPFVIAAHGNLDQARTLLAAHPEMLNVPWAKFDETALAAASHMGRREIAEFLLDAGAPLTLCAAAMLGRRDDVAAYIDADPALANGRGAHGIPVLYHAALSGDTAIADLLLAKGGGEGIDSALHAATLRGHLPMVEWLLAHGVTDVNTPNFAQKTPLQMAMDLGNEPIADLLRRHGGTA